MNRNLLYTFDRASEIYGLHLQFDTNGNLVVYRRSDSRIVKYQGTTANILTSITVPSFQYNEERLKRIALDSQNNLFVIYDNYDTNSTSTMEIRKYSADFQTTIASMTGIANDFPHKEYNDMWITTIAIDDNNRLYVNNLWHDSVKVLDSKGVLIARTYQNDKPGIRACDEITVTNLL